MIVADDLIDDFLTTFKCDDQLHPGAIIKRPAVISENCFIRMHAYFREGLFQMGAWRVCLAILFLAGIPGAYKYSSK